MNYPQFDLKRQQITDITNAVINIQCNGRRPIRNICCSVECKNPALHCGSQECQNCNRNHQWCMRIEISRWADSIKTEAQKINMFIDKLFEFEHQIIKKIAQLREQAYKKIRFGWMQQSQAKLLTIVFLQKSYDQLKGADGFRLKQIMKKSKQQKNQGFKLILERFTNQTNEILKRCEGIHHNALNQITEKITIDSKVVSSFEEKKLLKQWLNNPVTIDLLYRASQQQFSEKQFSLKCDEISDALVVAKTEAGKIVGGYTSLKMKDTKNKIFWNNPFEKGFIFCLTQKQKQDLLKLNTGMFGNSKLVNFQNIFMYNLKNQPKSNSLFSIPRKETFGSNIKVSEYEVFKVSWK